MKSKFWKFGGSALLALAITAMPVLSHADTISSGNFMSGTFSPTSPAAGDVVNLQIVGSLGTFTINTGTLTGGPGFFSFTGGNLDVTTTMGTFADTLISGFFAEGVGGSFVVTGFLTPTAEITTGSTSFNFTIENGVVVGGTAGVNFVGTLTFIPEPGTLGLMGTGMIGLAGLLKRKLKLS